MTIIKFLRSIFRMKPPIITEEEAMIIAKNACINNDYQWTEPVIIKEHIKYYKIYTNANTIGSNVIINIGKNNGKVLFINLIKR